MWNSNAAVDVSTPAPASSPPTTKAPVVVPSTTEKPVSLPPPPTTDSPADIPAVAVDAFPPAFAMTAAPVPTPAPVGATFHFTTKPPVNPGGFPPTGGMSAANTSSMNLRASVQESACRQQAVGAQLFGTSLALLAVLLIAV